MVMMSAEPSVTGDNANIDENYMDIEVAPAEENTEAESTAVEEVTKSELVEPEKEAAAEEKPKDTES